MHLHDEEIADREIVIGSSEATVLGKRLVLRRCRIASRAASKNLVVGPVWIIQSQFESKVTLRNNNWCRARLHSTTFLGHYVGCDFGWWPEYAPEKGEVIGCDFTKATLEGCRFFNCASESIGLPTWPGFSILNPRGVASEIKSIQWPGDCGRRMRLIAESPEGVTISCQNATSLSQRYGCAPSDLRTALERLPGLRL